MFTFILIGYIINLLVATLLIYDDYNKGYNITLKDLIYVVLFSIIPYSGVIILLWTLVCGFDMVIIKGKKK